MRRNFRGIIEVSSEMVKGGAFLYVLGLFVSVVYYSRFQILALNLTRPQYVLVGFYNFVLFGLIPMGILFLLKHVYGEKLRLILFPILLYTKNYILGVLLCLPAFTLLLISIIPSAIEFVLYSSYRNKKLTFSIIPANVKILLLLPLLSLYFALAFFPNIKGEFGGGAAYEVDVYPREKKLLQSRRYGLDFRKGDDKYLNAYSVNLLYESDTEYYFVKRLTVNNGKRFVGYRVIRIEKTQFHKIEYKSPRWF